MVYDTHEKIRSINGGIKSMGAVEHRFHNCLYKKTNSYVDSSIPRFAFNVSGLKLVVFLNCISQTNIDHLTQKHLSI